MEAAQGSTTHEWPFTVELMPLSHLMVDLTYQRPPQDSFVEKIITEFDETLVGTLDVSHRESGQHAILDGAQRYQALLKYKSTVWCSVYKGMDLAAEAMFFYRKNRNRRSVHPYYQFRALVVTGDRRAIDITRIVESEGYKLGVGAGPDNIITAVRAAEDAYMLSSLERKESLSPALRAMRACFFGRKAGKEGTLIRGLARFFQPFAPDDVDMGWLIDQLAGQNPQTLIGRAEDRAEIGRQPAAYHLARDVCEIYNRGRKGAARLPIRSIVPPRT